MLKSRYRVRLLNGVISTDDIIPGRYKHMFTDPKDLVNHVFENLLPDFGATLRPGDALFSDSLFGIGSSREQAVSSLAAAGIRAVVAPCFGRIFFRNAWNLSLPAIELDPMPSVIAEGEQVSIDLSAGTLLASGGKFRFAPPTSQMLEMLEQGGLLALVQKRLKNCHPIKGPHLMRT